MGVDPLQRSIVRLCVDAAARPLPAGIAAAANCRVVDTFAAYYAAWQLETCRDARRWALSTAQSGSASIVGTTDRVSPEIAAFVNGLSARSSELNDTLHVGGKQGAHPSDLIMPLLAVAEHNHTTGAQYLSAVAIGYEIFLRLFDLADSGCLRLHLPVVDIHCGSGGHPAGSQPRADRPRGCDRGRREQWAAQGPTRAVDELEGDGLRRGGPGRCIRGDAGTE